MKGIVVVIKGEELSQLVRNKAAEHASRSAAKQDELPALKEAWARVSRNMGNKGDAVVLSSYTNNSPGQNPVESLESQIRHHDRAANRFCFLAEYFAKGEAYKLTLRDCEELELWKDVR